MHKGKKTSNTKATDALAALLKAGFTLVASDGENTRPTARNAARQSRHFAGSQNAAVSNSGKSVFLTGNHAQTQRPVKVHLPTGGMLTVTTRDALRKQTGLDL